MTSWRPEVVTVFFAEAMSAPRVELVPVARTCFSLTVSPTFTSTFVAVQVPLELPLLELDELELELEDASPVVGALPKARLQLVAAAIAPVDATSFETSVTVAVEVR